MRVVNRREMHWDEADLQWLQWLHAAVGSVDYKALSVVTQCTARSMLGVEFHVRVLAVAAVGSVEHQRGDARAARIFYQAQWHF
jgi:hypothetical protein